jgi:8-oxo-dGTP pyrophosphatase MutT (NUDIX family)
MKNQTMEKRTLETAGLLVIKDNKLLLAYSKNKKAWYLPGGKIDQGEDTLMALQREILEELNVVLVPERITYYCHITAPAYGENGNIIMEQDCFLYELKEDIHPNNEIEEIKYFDYNMYMAEEKQVIGVLKVMEQLTEDGILVY